MSDLKSLDLEQSLAPIDREAIIAQLRPGVQSVFSGASIAIDAPNIEVGRALVEGEAPILKVALDELTKAWGEGPLKGQESRIVVGDFTNLTTSPEQVIASLTEQLPAIDSPAVSARTRSFSDYHPGVVLALLGVDSISLNVDVSPLEGIAKRTPAVFISTGRKNFSQLNPNVKKAVGDYAAKTVKLK